MNTPNVSGSSKGKMWIIANVFVSRRTEVLDTPGTSGSSKGEVWGTPNGSSSSKEVWGTPKVSGSRGTESCHAHNVSSDRGTEVLERQCEDIDPRQMIAEVSRHTSDISQQPSAYGDQTSNMKEMSEIMKEMDKKIIALPGRVIQIQHQEKKENEMLKEKIKKLAARIQELLANVMAMHQHSEDINDPSHLSAVLEVMMQDVMKLFRQYYHQNSMVYKKTVQEAPIHTGTENETQFLLQCCQIDCLLLLQDPPVKAEWKMNRRYLQHVDKEDVVHWKKPPLL